MPPPATVFTAAARRRHACATPLPPLHAHQSRLGALLLEPPRPTVAWAHRRRPEPRRRLPCSAPPPTAAAAGRSARRLLRRRTPRRALPGGEEAPPTDQWGPLVSGGVKGGILFILCLFGL